MDALVPLRFGHLTSVHGPRLLSPTDGSKSNAQCGAEPIVDVEFSCSALGTELHRYIGSRSHDVSPRPADVDAPHATHKK